LHELTRLILRRFRQNDYRSEFIVIGVAAGVSAAFTAPLGALLFALEEISSQPTTPSFIIHALAACVLAPATSTILDILTSDNNSLPVISQNQLQMFDGSNAKTINLWDIPFLAVLAALIGLVGGAWTLINIKMAKFRLRRISTPTKRILELVFIAVLYASLCYALQIYLTDTWSYACRPAPALSPTAHVDLVRGACPEGQYHSLSTLLFQPQHSTIQDLLFRESRGLFELPSLLLAFIVYVYTHHHHKTSHSMRTASHCTWTAPHSTRTASHSIRTALHSTQRVSHSTRIASLS
jgi:hypothetical protein